MEDAVMRARVAFRAHYGYAPRWIASAPGRLNLIGEHIDYNDGFVLPMAIELRTAIAAAPNGSQEVVLRSSAVAETARIDLSQPLAPERGGRWINYPKGVLAGFREAGVTLEGFEAFIESTVPPGAGLSSSAALEASLATLLEAVSGVRLDPLRKVLLCQKAEQSFAGVPVGIMDPFVCVLGRERHALLLDCRSNTAEWLPLDDPRIAILIIDTNVRHQLVASEYAARHRQCAAAAQALSVPSLREATFGMLEQQTAFLDPMSAACARHVIGEISRTLRAAACIRERNWPELGRLMNASHDSLRVDYRVSCPELDAVVEIARHIGRHGGVYGCRLTGGGFGGCTVALIEAAARESIMREIGSAYRQRTGIDATLIVSQPAGGASCVDA